MGSDDSDRDEPKARGPRGEYIFLGVLLVLALAAFPAFRDVQAVQDFVLAICAGVGLH